MAYATMGKRDCQETDSSEHRDKSSSCEPLLSLTFFKKKKEGKTTIFFQLPKSAKFSVLAGDADCILF